MDLQLSPWFILSRDTGKLMFRNMVRNTFSGGAKGGVQLQLRFGYSYGTKRGCTEVALPFRAGADRESMNKRIQINSQDSGSSI
jgi:hypothetical protein